MALWRSILEDGMGVEATDNFLGKPLPRPWVARITGTDERYGLARQFQRALKDHNDSDAAGSRGVYAYYFVGPGIYEVKEQVSWQRWERYFLHVDQAGEKTVITKEDILAWLKNDTSE